MSLKRQTTSKPGANNNQREPQFSPQAKLKVGSSNDAHEKEADSVADNVVQPRLNVFGKPAFFQPNPMIHLQLKAEAEKKKQNEAGENEIQEKSNELTTEKKPKIQTKGDTAEDDIQKPYDARHNGDTVPDNRVKPTLNVFGKPAFFQPNPMVHLQLKAEEARRKEKEGKENEIQEKSIELSSESKPKVQAMGENPEDEIQKSNGGNQEGGAEAIEADLSASKGGGSPLDDETRGKMESGIGNDFSNVRVHTDSKAQEMNQKIGAQAFTNGSDVYFNQGKYNPSSKEGQHLLAHELTHTVQQGASGDKVQRREVKSIYKTASEVVELLSGYTSEADSGYIVNKFRWKSASDVRKLMVELKSGKHSSTKGNAMVLWLMNDLVEKDQKEMIRILLRSNSYSGKWYVAHQVIEYISGYTSKSNSATIVDYFYAMNIFDVIKVMEVMQKMLGKNKENTEAYLLEDLTEEDQNKIKDLLDIRSKKPKGPTKSANGYDSFLVGTSFHKSAFFIQVAQRSGDSKTSVTVALRTKKMYSPDESDVSKRKMFLDIDEDQIREPKIIRETEYKKGDTKTKLIQLEIIPNDDSSRVTIGLTHFKSWMNVPFPDGLGEKWEYRDVQEGSMHVSHNGKNLDVKFLSRIPGSRLSGTVTQRPRQHPALGYVFDDKVYGKAYIYPMAPVTFDPRTLISAIIYTIPIVGSLVMIGESIVGRDIWGRELSATERALLAAGALLSALGPVIRATKSTVATIKTTNQVAKLANISKIEALQYVRGMKALTTSERAALTRYANKIEGGAKLIETETKTFEKIMRKLENARRIASKTEKTARKGFSELENEIINDMNSFYNSKKFKVLRNANKKGKTAKVTFRGIEVQYQHNFTYAEAFNNEKVGWTMGPKAFKSELELKKTILHERFRNVFDPKNSLGADAASEATKNTASFADRAVEHIK